MSLLTSIRVLVVACIFICQLAVADDYAIRCDPGNGQPRMDGVLCLDFSHDTHIYDFGGYLRWRKQDHTYVSNDKRSLAMDCPTKAWNAPGQTYELMRRHGRGELKDYITLEGLDLHDGHQCCVIEWAEGNGQPQKWCPNMAPLLI